MFDPDWYLEHNRDVKEAGADPLLHYARYGGREGRDPSPLFDTDWYLQHNPDVRPGIDNPLVHYLRHLSSAQPSRNSRQEAAVNATPVVRPRALIVAFLDIPQCAKYRVWQRKEQIEALGCICTIIEWKQHDAVHDALKHHTIVIFYRVPAYPPQLANIAEAQRLGLSTFWEVDDLIFDRDAYLANPNFHLLATEVQESILLHIPKYRAALVACRRGIASTRVLAQAVKDAGAHSADVIENALDAETLAIVESIRSRRAEAARKPATIFYGSGSNAHHADFECAAEGLYNVMRDRPEVRLLLAGELRLPASFAAFDRRVERVSYVAYPGYLDLLARSDINLAPLAAARFNDAKSNIKYIEASALGVPSICSPRDAFATIITHGVDGFLADTPAQWQQALLALLDDPLVGARIGKAARDNVQKRYAPEVVTKTQVAVFLWTAGANGPNPGVGGRPDGTATPPGAKD